MSKPNGNSFSLITRTGLILASVVVLSTSAMAIEPAAAAEAFAVKLDRKDLLVTKKLFKSGESNNGSGATTIKSVRTKAPREEEPKFKTVTIGKGDREEEGKTKKLFPRIAIGKGDRDEEGKSTKTQQIVVGKSDQAEADELPVKRQVIVEPKAKKKIVVTEAAPKKVQKVLVASTEAPAKKVVVADEAAAEETPAVEPEAQTEAPVAEEQATTEAQAAPAQKFEVGQIVTAGDGKTYVIVSVDDLGISAMPLSAFVDYQPVHKVYKKKRYKKRYTNYGYGSYGGSSCH